MTREQAHNKHRTIGFTTSNRAILLIDEIYDDFEKEKEQLKKDRDYWKLSFEKQVEASRRKKYEK